MRIILSLLVFCVFVQCHAAAEVAVINVRGEIDAGQTTLVKKALAEAKEQKFEAVIVNIDTFGGLVDAGTQIRDLLLDFPGETVCYINNRAWSAGALIAIACNKIYMATEASVGAAEPIPATEKTIAALKAEFSATALRTGRNPQVAEAMVDKTMGFVGIAEKGQILALNSYQAKEVGYSLDTVANIDELLAKNNWQNEKIIQYQLGWGEKLVGWLSNPTVKAVLVGVLILAIMTEIKMAGWGAAAVIGGVAAILLFATQWLGGVAAWWNVLLLIAGLVLLVVELYVGSYGVLAATGLIMIFAGLFFTLGADIVAAKVILYAVLGAIVVFLVLLRWLPNGKLWRKLILKDSEQTEQGFIVTKDFAGYIGKTAIVKTTLRPAGVVVLSDKTILDVVSEGSFVEVGVEVEIIKVDGGRIVVRPL